MGGTAVTICIGGASARSVRPLTPQLWRLTARPPTHHGALLPNYSITPVDCPMGTIPPPNIVQEHSICAHPAILHKGRWTMLHTWSGASASHAQNCVHLPENVCLVAYSCSLISGRNQTCCCISFMQQCAAQ